MMTTPIPSQTPLSLVKIIKHFRKTGNDKGAYLAEVKDAITNGSDVK